GPETRAVLAQPPAFHLALAGIAGHGERALRFTVGTVLFGVEAGKVPADDLVRGISLDALSARVPVGNAPLGVEHVDRVIGYTLHEQAELLLVRARRDPLAFLLVVTVQLHASRSPKI